jgi:hypothetical protein
MEPSSPANSLNVFGEISGSAVVVRQQSSGLASNLDVYDDRFPLNAGGRWRFAIQPTTFTFALLSNTAAAGDFSTDNIVFFAYPNGQMSFNSHIWPSSDGVGGNHNLGMPGFAWSNVYYYSLAAASDAALKRDIVDLPNQVLDDIVLPLRPRQFRWIGGPPDVHWGFVASEVGEVMAAAGQDFGGHTTDAETGLQYLAYNELIAILWRGMQELAGRLEALEARV